MDYRLLFNMANIYFKAGDMNTFREMAKEIEKEALDKINENPKNISGYYNPYLILKVIYEYGGEFDKEIDILNRMMSVAGKSQELQDEIVRITKLKDSLSVKK
jgi:hypothetical protein